MSNAFEIFCLICLFAIPVAVGISTWIGVGGCVYFISSNVDQIGTAFLPFKNVVPNSASAADTIKFFIILHSTYTSPFILD